MSNKHFDEVSKKFYLNLIRRNVEDPTCKVHIKVTYKEPDAKVTKTEVFTLKSLSMFDAKEYFESIETMLKIGCRIYEISDADTGNDFGGGYESEYELFQNTDYVDDFDIEEDISEHLLFMAISFGFTPHIESDMQSLNFEFNGFNGYVFLETDVETIRDFYKSLIANYTHPNDSVVISGYEKLTDTPEEIVHKILSSYKAFLKSAYLVIGDKLYEYAKHGYIDLEEEMHVLNDAYKVIFAEK